MLVSGIKGPIRSAIRALSLSSSIYRFIIISSWACCFSPSSRWNWRRLSSTLAKACRLNFSHFVFSLAWTSAILTRVIRMSSLSSQTISEMDLRFCPLITEAEGLLGLDISAPTSSSSKGLDEPAGEPKDDKLPSLLKRSISQSGEWREL